MKTPNMKGMGFPVLICALLAALLFCGVLSGDVTVKDANGNVVNVIPE